MSPDEWESLSPQEAADWFNDYYESLDNKIKDFAPQDAKTWSDAIGIKIVDTSTYNEQFILSLTAFGPKIDDAFGIDNWAIKAVYWFYIADNIGTIKASYTYYRSIESNYRKHLKKIDVEDIPKSAQPLAIEIINEKFSRLHYFSPTKNCFLNYRGGIL